jgi:Ca2+-binding EF-hand superfamily protein
MTFLSTLRSFKPLINDNILRKACKDYGELSNYSDKELREHISCFGSDFKHVGQIKRNGYDNPVELIMNILTETEDYINNILFSKLYIHIGLYYDEETKRSVLIFTDEISNKKVFEKTKTITRRVNRPQLTNDEIDQIKSHFKRFDVLNKGVIKPNIILTFVKDSNPIYIQALKMLDNSENNNKGVNSDLFINTISNILALTTDFREFFEFLCGIKRNITADMLLEYSKELNYQTSEGEIKDLVDNISEGGIGIKNTQFANLMKIVCNLK